MLAAFSTPVAAQPPGLVVSVAASVYDALDEIAGLYRATTGVTVALNAGGSNTLARQIVEGAKAGLFLSADEIQMDAVEKAGRIVAGTRTRLLTNELAIVVPQSISGLHAGAIARGPHHAAGDGRARRGARRRLRPQAGSSTKARGRAWSRRSFRFRPCARCCPPSKPNASMPASSIAPTRCPRRVRVIAHVSTKEHPYLDIAYPAAVIVGPSEAEARRFLEFLKGPGRARGVRSPRFRQAIATMSCWRPGPSRGSPC